MGGIEGIGMVRWDRIEARRSKGVYISLQKRVQKKGASPISPFFCKWQFDSFVMKVLSLVLALLPLSSAFTGPTLLANKAPITLAPRSSPHTSRNLTPLSVKSPPVTQLYSSIADGK